VRLWRAAWGLATRVSRVPLGLRRRQILQAAYMPTDGKREPGGGKLGLGGSPVWPRETPPAWIVRVDFLALNDPAVGGYGSHGWGRNVDAGLGAAPAGRFNE
jgi:hypothetical protein